MIETATMQDLPALLEIYAYARTFMAKSGNPHQWADGTPGEETLRNDIKKGQLFLCKDGDLTYGAFAFIIGTDPTYLQIEDGAWRSDTPYGTIHRIAGNGTKHGLLAEAVSFCEKRIPHLRIDTHRDNLVMRRLLPGLGFRECGIIYVADGSPRIAYEKVPEGFTPPPASPPLPSSVL